MFVHAKTAERKSVIVYIGANHCVNNLKILNIYLLFTYSKTAGTIKNNIYICHYKFDYSHYLNKAKNI